MRTFVQKPQAPSPEALQMNTPLTSKYTTPKRQHPARSTEVSSPPSLQRKKENQATPQDRQNTAERHDAASISIAGSRSRTDFTRIPVSHPIASANRVRQQSALDEGMLALHEPTAPDVALSSLISKSGHRPFDPSTRAFMESGFGRDLGHVRVHADRAGGDAATAINAQAFTTGRDIYFAHDRYQPNSAVGRHLIAHEVAHTIQQSHRMTPSDAISRNGRSPSVASPGDRFEGEADRAADALAAGQPATVVSSTHTPGLIQRQPSGKKPAPAAGTQVSITITVEKAMTPHEFAVRAFMQAFRMPGDVAEERVSMLEAMGQKAGTGPNFDHGVRKDEVGKRLKLNYPLPAQSAAEKADVSGRAQQVAAMQAEQRSAIDEETNKRFWRLTGQAEGTKLSATGRGDALNRMLWMRTRDDVVHDSNKIAVFQPRTRSLLLPGDKQPPPEQYSTVLRIANKLDSFSDDDWSLYQRRVNASTSDYATLEASVDHFKTQQKTEETLNNKIQGMTALYKAYRAARDTPKPFMGVGGGVSSAQIPGYDARYHKAQDDYAAALKANGFNDSTEFEATIANWTMLFRSRAVELTLLALKASEQAVRAEKTRYQDPVEVSSFHAQTATMRRLSSEADSASRRAAMTPSQARFGTPSTPKQQAASKEYQEKSAAAEAERSQLSETHPILKDQRLSTYSLNIDNATEFGSNLRDDAADRIADITKTRNRVHTDPDAIYQFDRVRELALQELGASGPESVGRLIVEDHLKAIAHDDLLHGLALGALAIGLGLLTFGTGTIAVLGAAGALTLSVYSASEEWDKYDKASAAAHTAFDTEKAVSSKDPTILWLAVSLVAIGFDGAALLKALKAAAPAAKVLAETGSAAKFEETLAKATELSESVQKALAKQAKAEEGFTKAAEDLSKYAGGRLNSLGILDPIYLAKVTKAAFYAAAENIRDFQLFLAKLKVQKFAKAIDLDKLTAAELEALEKAFNAGVKDFDGAASAAPAFSVQVPFVSGSKQATFGPKGELLLEGEKLSTEGAKHADVLKQLGLAHSYAGHGAGRDVVTIANEALQNATKGTRNGLSSIFASDEAMFRSLEAAREAVAAGKGTMSSGKVLVDITATPGAGRVFIAKSKLPTGVIPINDAPFAALPDVAELPVTHIRALFTKSGTGFEIFDIFPGFKQ
jgi:Domain of unknown function (DUF4157)